MKKFLGLILVLALFGCASAPEDNNSVSSGPAPEWITQLPADGNDYYLGISGSNTGDQTSDQELAYQKALRALASAISTEIQSSTELNEQESSQEGLQWSYESNISTSVSQNLEQVETVDTYYSDELGYWYYLRLSRADWDAVVERRSEELKEYVDDLFFDVFRDSLSELKAIDRAMVAYGEAYSGTPIKMELLGKRGSIETILILRAEELLSEMNIQWAALPHTLLQGQTLALMGQVVLYNSDGSDTAYRNPGAVTLSLIDGEGNELAQIPCDPDGTFSYSFEANQDQGIQDYTLTLSTPFSQDPTHQQLSYAYPSTTQQVDLLPMSLGFELEANWDSYGIYESAFNTMEALSPIALNSDPSLDQRLRMDLSFRQAPPNDWGMVFSYAKAFISYVNSQGERVIFESDEYKEAGLNDEQANQRAVEALFEALRANQEIVQILEDLEL